MKASEYNGSTLAFVGDAVYGLLVRERLINPEKPLKNLHASSVEFVNASAQAQAFLLIKDKLTETELSIFKRGRNTKAQNIPKNSNVSEYHKATGLETLFGYLFLSGQKTRLYELFSYIWDDKNKKTESI